MAPSIRTQEIFSSIKNPLHYIFRERVDRTRNSRNYNNTVNYNVSENSSNSSDAILLEIVSSSKLGAPSSDISPKTSTSDALHSQSEAVASDYKARAEYVEKAAALSMIIASFLGRTEDVTDPDILSIAPSYPLIAPQSFVGLKRIKPGALYHFGCLHRPKLNFGILEKARRALRHISSLGENRFWRRRQKSMDRMEDFYQSTRYSQNTGIKNLDLDGTWASYRILDENDRCSECKIRHTDCKIVEGDTFYTRGVCVECMRFKTHCSVNTALKKQKRQERDRARLSKQSRANCLI